VIGVMLALAFHIGDQRFGIPCADIVEVVPRVNLRDIPRAPPHVPGLFTYRGAVVPVIDLRQLLWNTPCADRMSTRIVLVRFPRSSPSPKLVGLLAERVTEAVSLDVSRAVPPGIAIADAPYLGDVHFDERGMIQLLELDGIVTGPTRAMLVGGEAE
jgi:chemotaxis-related protein WspB